MDNPDRHANLTALDPALPIDAFPPPLTESGSSAYSGPAAALTKSAMLELRRMMKWILAFAIAIAIASLWYISLFTHLTASMAAATIGGVFLSVVLGCGLFAAAFFSNNSGHDQAVGDAVPADEGREPNPVSLPGNLERYKSTDMFSEANIPAALMRDHTTKAEVWGLIRVAEGSLRYHITDPRRALFETILSPDSPPGIVEPTILHHIEPLGAVRFQVEFHRRTNLPIPQASQ
ncbi:MAG: DUF1971 domain-containing protein [Sphingomonas sp.]